MVLGHFCLKIHVVEEVKVLVHVANFEFKRFRTVLQHILVCLQGILTILNSHLHLVGDVSHNARLLDRLEVADVIAKELFSLCVHLSERFGHSLSLGVIESPAFPCIQAFELSSFSDVISVPFCEDLLCHDPCLVPSVVQAFYVLFFLAVSLSLTIQIQASHLAGAVAKLIALGHCIKVAITSTRVPQLLLPFGVFRNQSIPSIQLRSFDQSLIF